MSVLNKIAICLFCSECACWMSICYDEWAAVEACGLAYLNCGGCAWTVFAPICHKCQFGDCDRGKDYFIKGAKFFIYSLALNFVSWIDGIINCVLYQLKNFKRGVSGSSDML